MMSGVLAARLDGAGSTGAASTGQDRTRGLETVILRQPIAAAGNPDIDLRPWSLHDHHDDHDHGHDAHDHARSRPARLSPPAQVGGMTLMRLGVPSRLGIAGLLLCGIWAATLAVIG